MTISRKILQDLENNNPTLTILEFQPESGISHDDIKHLVQAALKNNNRNIKEIVICNEDLNDDSVRELIKLDSVEVLNLSGNNITDEGAIAIAKMMPNLKQLVLGGNSLTDKCVQSLAEQSNLSLLYLYYNGLSNECCKYFLNNTSLVEISLMGNAIDQQMEEIVEKHIANNKMKIERESITPAKESAFNPQNNQNTFFGKNIEKCKESGNNTVLPAEQARIKQSIVSQLKLLSESGQIQLIEDFITNNKLSDKINLSNTRSLVE